MNTTVGNPCRFVKASSKYDFLKDPGDYTQDAIVFMEDTHEIYLDGKFYGTNIFPNLLLNSDFNNRDEYWTFGTSSHSIQNKELVIKQSGSPSSLYAINLTNLAFTRQDIIELSITGYTKGIGTNTETQPALLEIFIGSEKILSTTIKVYSGYSGQTYPFHINELIYITQSSLSGNLRINFSLSAYIGAEYIIQDIKLRKIVKFNN